MSLEFVTDGGKCQSEVRVQALVGFSKLLEHSFGSLLVSSQFIQVKHGFYDLVWLNTVSCRAYPCRAVRFLCIR